MALKCMYLSASHGDDFSLWQETGDKGDRYVQLRSYIIAGDTVTCQSDEVSETATVNVAPGGNIYSVCRSYLSHISTCIHAELQ